MSASATMMAATLEPLTGPIVEIRVLRRVVRRAATISSVTDDSELVTAYVVVMMATDANVAFRMMLLCWANELELLCLMKVVFSVVLSMKFMRVSVPPVTDILLMFTTLKVMNNRPFATPFANI